MIEVKIIPNPKMGKHDFTEEDRLIWRKDIQKQFSPLLEEIEKEGVVFTIQKTGRDEMGIGFTGGSPELREKLYRRQSKGIEPEEIEITIAKLKAEGHI